MKKYTYILFFFFILLTCRALAGTTTLTTYYPPPTAAYNTVKLAPSANGSSPACNSNGANNGTVYTDSNGALHVCMNGAVSSYPQQCYNSFCSYNNPGNAIPVGSSTCANWAAGTPSPQGQCQQGFIQKAVDPGNDLYDQFQTSADTTVISIVCCSS